MDTAEIVTGRSAKLHVQVLVIRCGIVALFLLAWEGLSLSGLLYQGVVPPIQAVAATLLTLWSDPSFYGHVGTTAYEVAFAMAIGVFTGLFCGIVLGGSPFAQQAFERYLHYIGPVPKIIFFPIMIMWFGVGPNSKIALGAISCFFPLCFSTAAGMREIPPILIRVGRSFQAKEWQMISKIYLPAMREPVVNGIRLGFGITLIGTLLAETKISNSGLGFLVIQSFQQFNISLMYALIITIFIMSSVINTLLSRLVEV